MTEPDVYGIIGVFASPEAIRGAARQLHSLGYRTLEAYSPYPVEGLDEVLRPGRTSRLLALVVFAGAVFGAVWGFFIQNWAEVLNYPLNVGGRPYFSWPAFIVSAFQFMLLCGVAFGFFGLLLACRLPRLYHPIFNAEEFERAAVDRFVLCVEARDPGFDPGRILRIFERYGAERVAEVPA